MKYDALVKLVGKSGWFDLATLVQLSGESRKSLTVQLYRWCKSNMLVPLRRGFYTLPERYRTTAISLPELANILYSPSYLSTHWALGYYGLIPEYVVQYTSVTSRKTFFFENGFGSFRYQNIKSSAFFGYKPFEIDHHKVLLAEPDKALLDLWYLTPGQWTPNRIAEMRFQGFELIDAVKLQNYTLRFKSPRLTKATRNYLELAESEKEGVIQL